MADQQPSGILRYFEYEHLTGPIKIVSATFWSMSRYLEGTLPAGPEKSVALRKLLEAKDAAVRAALDLDPSTPVALGVGLNGKTICADGGHEVAWDATLREGVCATCGRTWTVDEWARTYGKQSR